MYNDDDFNWNYGIAQAAVGNYKEAEETLLLVMNEKYHQDYCYLSWLCRCYIMNKKTKLAWEQYLKMDTSNDSFSLLQLIANDCYKVGSVPHTPARARRLARGAQDPHHARVACRNLRWAPSSTLRRHSTSWSVWTPTQSTGRESAAPAWGCCSR